MSGGNADSVNCFLPFKNGTTSGYIQPEGSKLRFVSLYVDMSRSAIVDQACDFGDCSYGRHRYTSALRILEGESYVEVRAFVDQSVIEVFGQGGRASVTARVYPTLKDSTGVGVYYQGGKGPGRLESLDAWHMASAE